MIGGSLPSSCFLSALLSTGPWTFLKALAEKGCSGGSSSFLFAGVFILKLHSQIKRWIYKRKPTNKVKKLNALDKKMDVYLFMSEKFMK